MIKIKIGKNIIKYNYDFLFELTENGSTKPYFKDF